MASPVQPKILKKYTKKEIKQAGYLYAVPQRRRWMSGVNELGEKQDTFIFTLPELEGFIKEAKRRMNKLRKGGYAKVTKRNKNMLIFSHLTPELSVALFEKYVG